ncbi:Uncharacterised protein [Streptomyces griseus]|uniref:Uncharacterized protein n=1 Tax=Streptomyces griseus TaxID=1911 RepID=A0A380P9M4_STRGR|nr:Uncharacterised protein [Streptomyces griseus]
MPSLQPLRLVPRIPVCGTVGTGVHKRGPPRRRPWVGQPEHRRALWERGRAAGRRWLAERTRQPRRGPEPAPAFVLRAARRRSRPRREAAEFWARRTRARELETAVAKPGDGGPSAGRESDPHSAPDISKIASCGSGVICLRPRRQTSRARRARTGMRLRGGPGSGARTGRRRRAGGGFRGEAREDGPRRHLASRASHPQDGRQSRSNGATEQRDKPDPGAGRVLDGRGAGAAPQGSPGAPIRARGPAPPARGPAWTIRPASPLRSADAAEGPARDEASEADDPLHLMRLRGASAPATVWHITVVPSERATKHPRRSE